MYAIFKTGGKQYKAKVGDVIKIEKLDSEIGSTVKFDEILLIADDKNITVGAPFVSGATIDGEVKEQKRDKKIIIFKKKRRQNYRRKNGHRQHSTYVEIKSISK